MTSQQGAAFWRGVGDLATKAFYYTRTPMLLLDSTGVLVDVNVACRVLLGLDVAGCKGQHFSFLEANLAAHIDAPIFPPDGTVNTHFRDRGAAAASGQDLVLATQKLRAVVRECRYYSDRFRAVSLRVCELPCVDSASGSCAGAVVTLEIVDMEDLGAFRAALDRRLGHEVMWEVYAASYDRILPEMPFYQEVVKRHCAALNPDSIRTVLDLGAGTGSVTVQLLHLGKRVTAVDVGRAMLGRLCSKVREEYVDQLTIVEDTAERLPHFRDGSFDGVNVLLAFFDMQDPASALGEAQRVLRPGGTLIVTEPRACFDVAQLMAAGEQSLRAKGLFERLARDWQQIQSVAPLVRDTIQYTSGQSSAAHSGRAWHAETIWEILRENSFTNLTFQESHLGSCATISGIKPK